MGGWGLHVAMNMYNLPLLPGKGLPQIIANFYTKWSNSFRTKIKVMENVYIIRILLRILYLRVSQLMIVFYVK